MAVPPFVDIPDSKIDADSPATEEIFTFLRDNILAVRGIEKVSKTFTDFQVAAASKTITLVNMPASSEIIHTYANVTTLFTGAGTEVLEIGDDDDPDINSFLKSVPLVVARFNGHIAADRGVRLDEAGIAKPPVISFSSTFNVTATVSAASNLDNLTAGVVDFYIIFRVLDI